MGQMKEGAENHALKEAKDTTRVLQSEGEKAKEIPRGVLEGREIGLICTPGECRERVIMKMRLTSAQSKNLQVKLSTAKIRSQDRNSLSL